LEGAFDSDLKEESDVEHSDEEVYLSQDDLELDDAIATASQAPKQKVFEIGGQSL
jgi:hypothetical protein